MKRLARIIILVLLVSFAASVVRHYVAPEKPVANLPSTETATVPWSCQEAMQALDLYQAGAARIWLHECRDDLVRAGQSTAGVDQAITLLDHG